MSSRTGALATSLLAVLASLSACGGTARTAVASVDTAPIAGETTTVVIPAGALRLTLGKAVDSVSASDAKDGKKHDSGGGWDYLPVRLAYDIGGGSGAVNTANTIFEPATVAVLVGDKRFDLPAPYALGSNGSPRSTPTTTYLPASGADQDKVTTLVTYDGLEQRLGPGDRRDAGAAEAYYDRSAATGEPIDCEDDWTTTQPGTTVSIGCTVTPTLTPYLPGVGWARKGTIFVAVDLALLVDDATRNGRTPRWRDLVVTPSLDAGDVVEPSEPIGLQPPKVDVSQYVRSVYFSAPAGQDHDLHLAMDVWGIPTEATIPLGAP